MPKVPSLEARQSVNRKPPRVSVQNHDPDAPMASEPTLPLLAAPAHEMDSVAGLDEDVLSARRRQFVCTLPRCRHI
ncbi:hypothetical protein AURDEDRAFT_157905 [Auricularia subglabra TFB-10046 SS5]|nr:hypothetical protein AURDEDRAFT_157905 [Auricularia subglabra TFB-10046 SS5]